jgi:hypothetical protein
MEFFRLIKYNRYDDDNRLIMRFLEGANYKYPDCYT